MRQLSGLDAGFLILESRDAPMLIGGVSILGGETADGRLTVERFRRVLSGRLAGAVALRRRLAELPLDLARPYWVELPPEEIDLEAHVERTQLPEPGGWPELSELMAFQLAEPLPRDRPLWHLLFVEGLRGLPGIPEGSVAVISRLHHAAIDGVSGAEILGALYDGPPPGRGAGRGASPAGAAAAAEPEPGVLDLLTRAGRDLAAAPLAAPRVVGRSLVGLAGGALSRLTRGVAPPRLFEAPKTPLNQPLGRRRSWAPAFFELERIKALKSRCEATVNDVVLAICAGALRGWLADQGELPGKPLVAMVPVSVRAREQQRDAGNQVSAMLVALATDEADPVARLTRIRDAARSAKAAHQAVGARTLVDSADLLPFALSGLAARLYTRLHLAERHRPLFNLVITNVPGPPRPLTLAGAPLLAHVGAAPLYDGLGMILPVFSYAGTVAIGVTADHAILPDAAAFAARLEASLDELERALPAGE